MLIYLLTLTTPFLGMALGWLLKGWEVDARKRREDAARERQFEAIVRLAKEEDAAEAGRCIDWWDARTGTVRRIQWDGAAINSFNGGIS